jgi:hypothetical protein
VGRAVLAVLADGAGGPAEAGAGDEALERAHLLGRLHGGDHLVGVGHVAGHEDAPELLGQRVALLLLAVQVGQHHVGAALGEDGGGGGAEAGGPAGDDG